MRIWRDDLSEFLMKAVRGKTFIGQRVVLDGKSFIQCHFKDASLIIEGNGLFEMQDCKIEEDCRLAVEGPGQVLLHVLKMMLYSGGWMSRVADNVLHTVRQPPKTMTRGAALANPVPPTPLTPTTPPAQPAPQPAGQDAG